MNGFNLLKKFPASEAAVGGFFVSAGVHVPAEMTKSGIRQSRSEADCEYPIGYLTKAERSASRMEKAVEL
jgi:hypothetical protein